MEKFFSQNSFSKNFLQKLSLLLLVVFLGGCQLDPYPKAYLQYLLGDNTGVKVYTDNPTMYYTVNSEATSLVLYTTTSTNTLSYTYGDYKWGSYEGANIKLQLFAVDPKGGTFKLWENGILIDEDNYTRWIGDIDLNPELDTISFKYNDVDYVYSLANKTLDATGIEHSFLCTGGVYYGYDGDAFRFFEIGDSSVKVAEALTDYSGDNNYIVEDGSNTVYDSYNNVIVPKGVSVINYSIFATVTYDLVVYGTITGDLYINSGSGGGKVGNIYIFGSLDGAVALINGTVTGDIYNFGTLGGEIVEIGTGTVTGTTYKTTDEIYEYLKDSKERIDNVLKYFEFKELTL